MGRRAHTFCMMSHQERRVDRQGRYRNTWESMAPGETWPMGRRAHIFCMMPQHERRVDRQGDRLKE